MNAHRNPWDGLAPARPPVALRTRVLAAARHAATQPASSLLEALYRDRLLRVCAAGLAALVIANAFVTRRGGVQARGEAPAAFLIDEAHVPGDAGLTAAEQSGELAPILCDAISRSRG